MKIAVIGSGYVGLSLSILLSKKNIVTLLDIDETKIENLKLGISPINDNDIVSFIKKNHKIINPTLDALEACNNADYIIIATPTDYDPIKDFFDTKSVELSIEKSLKISPKATIIIKSTVPIGFTAKISAKFNTENIIFSPEFLREGSALEDNLFPSRIIFSKKTESSIIFADILMSAAKKDKNDIPLIFTKNHDEAESIKLFANSYLATRIAFFNELDSFCEKNNLDSRVIIDGIGHDKRIGNYYNNPSFGYGGYCLPKDTKQLLANMKGLPNQIISASIKSNQSRKRYIASNIVNLQPKVVGLFRITMKKASENFRESAILDIAQIILENDIKVIIYEPYIKSDKFNGMIVINNIDQFKKKSDIIICNRKDYDLSDVEEKIYTRDIYQVN